MSEMVERVVDAIRGPINSNRSTFEDIARAAILAMREPTEAMVAALLDDMKANELCWDANEEVLRRVISKIVDAVLKA